MRTLRKVFFCRGCAFLVFKDPLQIEEAEKWAGWPADGGPDGTMLEIMGMPSMNHNRLKCLAIVVLCASGVVAQAQESNAAVEKQPSTQLIHLAVTAQPIAAALNDFARQSGLHVVIGSEVAKGVKSAPIEGTFTVDSALERLLKDTGLRYEYLDAQTVAVMGKEKPRAWLGNGDVGVRLAQAETNPVGASPTGSSLEKQNTSGTGRVSDGTLEEIIVTANKRAEPLNKAPASIGVLTGADLDATNAVDMQDVVNRVPGVSSSNGGAPGTSSFYIRGISAGGGTSTAVGQYIDDVSINTGAPVFSGAFEPAFFDLDRIEVLRGPQGTLYGADSFGGTIRYVNKQPQLDRYGVDITTSVYWQTNGDPGEAIRGGVNIPLIEEKLALRLSGIYQHDGGFIDHVAADGTSIRKNSNKQDVSGFRGVLLWQPDDNVKITPTLQYQTTKNSDNWIYAADRGQYNTLRALEEPLKDKFLFGALNVNVDFGLGSLTAVSSYVDRNMSRTSDFTVYDMTGFVAPAVAGFFDPTNAQGSLEALSGVLVPAIRRDVSRQWAQEVRLASHFDAIGLSTLFGLYFNRETRSDRSREDAVGFGVETQRLFGLSANEALAEAFDVPLAAANLGDILYSYDQRTVITRRAAYFEASWSPPSSAFHGLKLTAGARYSKIHESITTAGDGFFNGGPSITEQPFSENQVAPIFRITYEANDTTLVYASAGKGFRLGGANGALPPTCNAELVSSGITPPTAFKTDSIWSYEIGTKVGLLNRTAQLNASVFHIDWTNIAQSIFFPVCGFGFEANVGTAVSNGGDISLQLRPVTGLDIGIGVSYTNARFGTTVALANVQNGDPVPLSPQWTANISAGYQWPIGAGRGYVRADYYYTDVSRGALTATEANFMRPAYATVGGAGGFALGNWDISVYGKNLTNAHPPLTQETILGYYNVSTLRPRQIGVEANYQF